MVRAPYIKVHVDCMSIFLQLVWHWTIFRWYDPDDEDGMQAEVYLHVVLEDMLAQDDQKRRIDDSYISWAVAEAYRVQDQACSSHFKMS